MLFAVASVSMLLLWPLSNLAQAEISKPILELDRLHSAETAVGTVTSPDVQTTDIEKEPAVERRTSGFLTRIVACGTSLVAALITSELGAIDTLASPILAGIGTTLVPADSSIAPSPSSAVFLTLSIRLPASALPNR